MYKMPNIGYGAAPSPPATARPVLDTAAETFLSPSDVRLRLSHTIHNTEGGKKVSAAVSSTGRAVAGGLGAAKGAISSWWGGLKTEKASSPSVSEEPSPDAEMEEAREQKQSKD